MLLFILFGARNRLKTVSKGEFFCPNERQRRDYELKKGSTWFTLYFIPIFPMRQMKEGIVECQSCGHTYKEDVLVVSAKLEKQFQEAAQRIDPVKLINNLQVTLQQGMPIEYVVRELTREGYDRDVVMEMVKSNIGTDRVHCHHCGLSYTPNVTKCSECKEPVS